MKTNKNSERENKYKLPFLENLDTTNSRKSVANIYGISENSVARSKEIFDYNQDYFYNVLFAKLIKDEVADEGKEPSVWTLAYAERIIKSEQSKDQVKADAEQKPETPENSIEISGTRLFIKDNRLKDTVIQEKLAKISEERKIEILTEVVNFLTNLIINEEINDE